MQEKSTLRRWTSLILGLAATWAVCFVAAPAFVESNQTMTRMARFIDESGINTGKFYYTDVEACAVANLNTRNTVLYRPHGPGPKPVD
ncbi:hypothetical protein [Desulfocurvus sp.]|uniref:hypothetical protein n=1 Tax=Desulfocurvus sp. TaxID=2871698 RepID=UPI0025BFB7BB|nr:hypothetical protein [Desulfocurvus sp.]MCK9239320.1 hypothetical protein [Desulfocurvus sp.]